MCGIEGVISRCSQVSPELSTLAQEVQNRGEDAAGMGVITAAGIPLIHKGLGLVKQVFQEQSLFEKLSGPVGIAHVRYKTFGGAGLQNAQPFLDHARDGTVFILGHNGHIRNAESLAEGLRNQGCSFESTNDAEIMLKYVIHEWNKSTAKELHQKLHQSLQSFMNAADGGYSVVMAVAHPVEGKYLVAFKDPHGIRPGLIGKKERAVAVSSESIALESNGYRHIQDIPHGSVVIVDEELQLTHVPIKKQGLKICHFDMTYFSRASSFMNGRGLNDRRHELGKQVALENQDLWNVIDVVTYVPNCPQEMARAGAKAMGKLQEYKTAIEKNRYAGRVFLKESQNIREDEAERAFSVITGTVEGRRIAVFDDSIVRATNAKVITRKLRESGAEEVYWFVCTPPIKNPCQWGIDLKSHEELVAAHRTPEQVCSFIGADTVRYISQKGYLSVLSGADPTILEHKIKKGTFEKDVLIPLTPESFCTHCLDGRLPK